MRTIAPSLRDRAAACAIEADERLREVVCSVPTKRIAAAASTGERGDSAALLLLLPSCGPRGLRATKPRRHEAGSESRKVTWRVVPSALC